MAENSKSSQSGHRIQSGCRIQYKIIIAMTFFLMASCLMTFSGCDIQADTLSTPKYPQKTAFSDFAARQKETQSVIFTDRLRDFTYESASSVLLQNTGGENSLYSPLSLYISLVVSAAGSNGSTQKEILKALHMEDVGIPELVDQTSILFRNHYFDNEIGQLTIANSLWINKTFNIKSDFIKNMTEKLYLSSGRVDFSSDSAAEQINRWISKNTQGVNDPAVISKSAYLAMVLINAVQFNDEWINSFDSKKTKTDNFHLPDGSSIQADFMNAEVTKTFIKGMDYTSSYLQLKNDCNMVFILPDRGVSIDRIISDPALMASAADLFHPESRQMGEVAFHIPKFEFNAKIDLKNTLSKLGMINAFDKAAADFSTISDKTSLYISEVIQSSSISINEKGCKASSFTKTDYSTLGKSSEQIEMTLDRPFVFIIAGNDNIPVFIGKVENPLYK